MGRGGLEELVGHRRLLLALLHVHLMYLGVLLGHHHHGFVEGTLCPLLVLLVPRPHPKPLELNHLLENWGQSIFN